MAILYTRAVGLAVRSIKPPYPGILLDVVEHPTYLELRVYEDNINSFSDEQQSGIMIWLMAIKDKVAGLGIRCEIGGHEGNGHG